MTLEDHAGDVARKARQMMSVDVAAAATAAGLEPTEYEAFESSGKAGRRPRFGPLAGSVGLDAAKLERVFDGWLPEPPDLAQWREIRTLSTEEEGMSVHAYLAWDEVTREAALFDTGWKLEPILQLIEAESLSLKHLFITHTHRDHVGALTPLRERFPKLFIHTNAKGAPVQHRNRATDFIHLGSLRITHRDTPGHAEDGVTYLIGNFPDDVPNAAIVGDAIFAGSMGGAKEHGALAKQKVREQILTLPPGTLICPGHGPLTTVAQERANNPFF